MKFIKSFQDLQNETCEIYTDHLGNLYIGRRSSPMMNLSVDKLEEIYLLFKRQENDNLSKSICDKAKK